MQIVQDNATTTAGLGVGFADAGSAARSPFADYKVIRRNGAVVGFEPAKISVAMTKAFLAVNGAQGAASRQKLKPRLSIGMAGGAVSLTPTNLHLTRCWPGNPSRTTAGSAEAQAGTMDGGRWTMDDGR